MGRSERVSRRLDGALAEERGRIAPPLAVDEARIVVFSDHHKGARDGADDFQRCERAYCAALGYYLEHGFTLYVLGDAEELWEERPGRVIASYPEVLALEAEFAATNPRRLVRFFGNHDDRWAVDGSVSKYLGPVFGAITVREALLLPLVDGDREIGQLLFVHGHQGDKMSDRLSWLARPVVRYLWGAVQRRLGFSATTPSKDYGVRSEHDHAMFDWAARQRQEPPLVLIAGHTHRPIFSRPPRPERTIDRIAAELERARGRSDAGRVAGLRAELEHARAEARDAADASVVPDPPCYFNSGCCSFPDGDITGLEIVGGDINLVRWPDNEGEPRRHQLGTKPLRGVFDAVRAADPERSRLDEEPPPRALEQPGLGT